MKELSYIEMTEIQGSGMVGFFIHGLAAACRYLSSFLDK